jgi:CxxC motif-containing protein (DUF1111 family)
MSKTHIAYIILIIFVSFSACKKEIDDEKLPSYQHLYEPGEEFSAGTCSVNDASSLAFSFQVNGLAANEQLRFFTGNSFFNQNWVEAPSSTTARDGLGPAFNARSCSACHFRDGRGSPETGDGLLMRLSLPGFGLNGQPLPHEDYGGQLQDFAISNVPIEGQFQIHYTEQTFSFPDGETYALRSPEYAFTNLNYGPLANDILFSPRIGQQMIGLGLIENIANDDILSRSDPTDSDGDGISGRPNYVYDAFSQTTSIGRFGWKSNVANLYHQTASAFLGDIGITSWLFPTENCTSTQQDCVNAINGGSPEIDTDDLEAVVLYTRTLAVPKRRNTKDDQVLLGKKLFSELGCESCHRATFTTSNNNNIAPLNNVQIRPYTDLLLHDMGPGLSDNRSDFLATGNEWRTPPLWGLGLIEIVNDHTFLLHDGRARNLVEAIMWHGGEANDSKNNFAQLTFNQRQAVIKFLESL